MAAQALYRKWRSQDFDEVVAQEHVTRTLRNALHDGRVAHAYLFAGPRGTGKTSMARVLAKAVNCVGETEEKPCNQCHICRSITEGSNLDLIEIDAASNRGIDEMRDLREKVNFRPNECRYRVYILDEAHMLTTPAFNALLKTLEEPPAHTIFILVTTEPHNIPVTIISRCQRFDFRRIAAPDIVKHLKRVAAEEGFEITDEALEVVARQAAGGMRDALSLLDQLMAYRHEKITAERVLDVLGAAPLEAVSALARSLVLRDLTAGLRVINDALDQGADPRQFNKELLEYLRGILLLKMGAEATSLNVTTETIKQMQQLAQKAQLAALITTIRAFSQAALDLKESAHPRLPLEMALLESVVAEQIEPQSKPAPVAEAMATPKAPPIAQPEGAKSAPAATPKGETRPPSEANKSMPSASPVVKTPPENRPAPSTQSAVKPVSEPAASAAPKPAPAPVKGAPTLDWVQRNWREVLLAVRAQDRSVEALLNKSCEPTQLQDNVLSLAFFHDFHKQKIEQEKNKKIVEAALSELTGAPMAVKCVVYEGDGRQRIEQKEKEEKTQRQASAVEADPLVREAMDRYGGKIVDVQPLKE